jgi:hypothetical protein
MGCELRMRTTSTSLDTVWGKSWRAVNRVTSSNQLIFLENALRVLKLRAIVSKNVARDTGVLCENTEGV